MYIWDGTWSSKTHPWIPDESIVVPDKSAGDAAHLWFRRIARDKKLVASPASVRRSFFKSSDQNFPLQDRTHQWNEQLPQNIPSSFPSICKRGEETTGNPESARAKILRSSAFTWLVTWFALRSAEAASRCRPAKGLLRDEGALHWDLQSLYL